MNIRFLNYKYIAFNVLIIERYATVKLDTEVSLESSLLNIKQLDSVLGGLEWI